MGAPAAPPTWSPPPDAVAATRLGCFMRLVEARHGVAFGASYTALHAWSVAAADDFWAAVWEFVGFATAATTPYTAVSVAHPPGTIPALPPLVARTWFPGATVNVAAFLLRHGADGSPLANTPAVAWASESQAAPTGVLSHRDLRSRVVAVAAGLRARGLAPGDVVGGVVANTVDTVVVALAAAAVGAIWAAVGTDAAGGTAVVDRLGQLRPTLLVVSATTVYRGRVRGCLGGVAPLLGRLGDRLRTVVVLPDLVGGDGSENEGVVLTLPADRDGGGGSGGDGDGDDDDDDGDGGRPTAAEGGMGDGKGGGKRRRRAAVLTLEELSRLASTAAVAAFAFTMLPFSAPVLVLFSSGTTGSPKGLVQGAGVFLNHAKEHVLHSDLSPASVLLFYSSPGYVGLLGWGYRVPWGAVGITPASDPFWVVRAILDASCEGVLTCIPSDITVLVYLFVLVCLLPARGCSHGLLANRWMMWNWAISAIATGTTVVLYDGSPLPPGRPTRLWEVAAATGVTHFGASARYYSALEAAGVSPADAWPPPGGGGRGRSGRDSDKPFPALRSVYATGSPSSPANFHYIARVLPDVAYTSISGGSDINGCWCLGCPILPVHPPELQVAALGADVCVLAEDGVTRLPLGVTGELACANAVPNMPLAFWGDDASASRYTAAYFAADRGGPWRHGDFAERTLVGGWRIHGRSDATLNPGGVRLGTADLYRVVEADAEVADALGIAQAWEGDVRVVLWVALSREGEAAEAARWAAAAATAASARGSTAGPATAMAPPAGALAAVVAAVAGWVGRTEGLSPPPPSFSAQRPPWWLSPALQTRLRGALRTRLSPRHVPALLLRVSAVPVTVNGKKVEVVVKRAVDRRAREGGVLPGAPPRAVAGAAIANPEALDEMLRCPLLWAPTGDALLAGGGGCAAAYEKQWGRGRR
ncbi:hypothetical protein MMPV_005339 [Pyropia vietnamensis]